MTALGWGQPRPTNRPGVPGGAASNWLRIKRALMRFSGIDAGLLGTLINNGSRWVKVTKTYADFSAAATTKTLTAYTVPIAAVVNKMVLRLDTPFLGGAIASYTITPVTIADVFTYDVFGHAAGQFTWASESSALTLGQPYELAATRAIELRADSTGANLSAATQGAITFWLEYSTLPSP